MSLGSAALILMTLITVSQGRVVSSSMEHQCDSGVTESGVCLLQHQTRLSALKHLESFAADNQLNMAAKHLQSIRCSDNEDTLLVLKTESLNASSLDTALNLGAKFLMSRQKPEGNFHYEYDWEKKENSDDDNSVRQAGTTWGLAFLHASEPSPELSKAVLKALKFFEQYSVQDKYGRFVRYPGEPNGKLGTIALLALAHIDFLRSKPQINEQESQKLNDHLKGYIKFLLSAETSNGDHKHHVFHGKYKHSGKPFADDSAYFDGEALLALTRAARHLNREDLWKAIPRLAKGSWEVNVENWIKQGEDVKEDGLKRLKGFYQWSSMAMYELLQTPDEKFEPFQQRILRYADWRLATAKYPLDGEQHNIAVTLEGLTPAYLIALQAKDSKRAEKIGCLLRKGIRNLNIMQVGHPEAEGGARKAPVKDPHAFGGVQNGRDSPKLRIDTTQHQMHAVLQIKQMLTSSQSDPLLF